MYRAHLNAMANVTNHSLVRQLLTVVCVFPTLLDEKGSGTLCIAKCQLKNHIVSLWKVVVIPGYPLGLWANINRNCNTFFSS